MTFENAVERAMMSCHNYFERSYKMGDFRIVNGKIVDMPYSPFVLIVGSARNDGVHMIAHGFDSVNPLVDENFSGKVWMLYPPDDFLDICRKMTEYDEKVGKDPATVSESFGNYSHSFASGESGAKITAIEAFKAELVVFRKMFTEVDRFAV